MSQLLLRSSFPARTLGASLGLGLCTYNSLFHRPQIHHLDGAFSDGGFATGSGGLMQKVREANDDLKRKSEGRVPWSWRVSAGTARQVSGGSIVGLCAGLLVSTFSRPLAIILGLLVVGVQWASNHGINLIPYSRLQKYVKGIDLQSAIHDNVAFKISFGTTFALAAFMQF